MALDEAGHRLYVATRAPARLAVFDTHTGHMVTALPCVQGSDDLYFDPARKRIYVPAAKVTSACFNKKTSNTTNPSRKFRPPWVPAPPDTSAREEKDLKSSTWLSQPEPKSEPKSCSTSFRTSGGGPVVTELSIRGSRLCVLRG